MVADEVMGPMGLMLDIPQVRIFWLLAVAFTSKDTSSLVCLLHRVGREGKQTGLVQNALLPKLMSLAAPQQDLPCFTLQFW